MRKNNKNFHLPITTEMFVCHISVGIYETKLQCNNDNSMSIQCRNKFANNFSNSFFSILKFFIIAKLRTLQKDIFCVNCKHCF